MSVTEYLVSGTLLAALALIALVGTAVALPSDFTLGPGGEITISADEDSTTSGCLGSDSSECDSYSIKIPFSGSATGDLSADLMDTKNIEMEIGAAGQLCSSHMGLFFVEIPEPSLNLSKTKTTQSAKFTGAAAGSGPSGAVTVPISFTIKAKRNTGVGTLTVKGLGQGLNTLSGPSVDFVLQVQDTAADADIDFSCVTVPATFHKLK